MFFCCDNCPKGFAAKVKEDKLVQAKGNHQLIATGQVAQAKCPFAGRACKAETAIKVAGAKIAFCCENCQAKAKKMEGNEQLVALFGDAAYEKAAFKIEKEEFTSEGSGDPNATTDKDSGDTTSEGAKDPNEVSDKDDPETTSEGAEDPK